MGQISKLGDVQNNSKLSIIKDVHARPPEEIESRLKQLLFDGQRLQWEIATAV